MNIILLRHEKREDNPEFNTVLTEQGKIDSLSILIRLNNSNIDIDHIYCSPYIRCLQTLDYFSKITKNEIKIEYSLSEFFETSYIGKKIPIIYNENELQEFNIDNNYKSYIDIKNIKQDDNWKIIIKRCKVFMDYIIKHYSKTDKVILICTHLSIINALLYCNNNNIQQNDPFEMGKMIDLQTNLIL